MTIFSSGTACRSACALLRRDIHKYHAEIVECAQAGTFAYSSVGVYRNRDLIFEVDVVVCVAMLH